MILQSFNSWIFLFQDENEKSTKPLHDVSHFDLLTNTHSSAGEKIRIESIWLRKEGGGHEQILVSPCRQNLAQRQPPQKILDSEYMKFAELVLEDKVGSLEYSVTTKLWTMRGGETGKFLF